MSWSLFEKLWYLHLSYCIIKQKKRDSTSMTKDKKIPILLQRKVLDSFLLPWKNINLFATLIFDLIHKIPGLVEVEKAIVRLWCPEQKRSSSRREGGRYHLLRFSWPSYPCCQVNQDIEIFCPLCWWLLNTNALPCVWEQKSGHGN